MEYLIVVFFLSKNDENDNNNSNNMYIINIYDFNLNLKAEKIQISSYVITNTDDYNAGYGIFFKSVYIKNYIGAFTYFTNKDRGDSLNIRIGKININSNSYSFTALVTNKLTSYTFQADIRLNDFLKVNDERLIFISTSSDYKTLYILFIDLFNEYNNMKIRIYESKLYKYKVIIEFTSVIFNNYLAFSSTAVLSSATDENNYFPILMIFGYANGTDNTIDISPYFMDDNINNENNLITKLIENIHIDNNLFGYQIVEKIKLISIPEQIIFYNDVTPLTNGDILNKEYTFKQNMDINKTNEYYSLEYQFIIEEPDSYSDYSKEVINEPSDDSTYIYKKSQFLGRKNTVIFKLCHNYCASCKKFGISNNNQQCLSCLPLYQYDYFSELQSNCVPEGFFIDKENNDNLVECNDTNSKFYFDLEKNKKICFKITYDCPPDYHYFNISTNECQNYTPATTIITTIPTTIITTIITTIPTTIITSIPTTITTTIPTTIITSIPTTIITTIPSTIITTIPTTLISTIPSAIITTIPTTLISTIPSTIITTIPTTLISTIPTSIITSIPTTIITSFPTTILTSIVTTISNNIPTTLVSAIPSTLPISIITTIPKNIISTGFTTIPTSISLTTIPTTVGNRCSYLDLLYSKCSFLNYNNTEIYNIIKEEIINIYPENGESIIILGEDNYAFQLTTGINEINSLNGNYENKYNLSMIDLGKCEELLKQEYNIDSDTDLIFLKFEKLTNYASEKNVQYEIYNQKTKEKLNLTICNTTSIDLYIPISLDEKT